MKTFIIDTNALLSFVTDRNLEQQDAVSVLFDQAAHLKCKIFCHQHVITEFVYVLEKVYCQSKLSINQIIGDFISMPGVEIRHDVNFKTLLQYWPNAISDFGDAVVASLWKSNSTSSVVTFDKRFTKEIQQLGATVYPIIV